MADNNILKLENVTKYYHKGGNTALGLNNVSLEFNIGEFVAITGESGSGKSTLLNVISGNDTFEEGEMYFNGNNTSHYLEKDWEEYRNNNVSFIFQKYNIVKGLTVHENIELALIFSDYQGDYDKRIDELLNEVGMIEYKKSRANELSGGQKQRVVIARALASGSPIIAADEPTGNLDSKSSEDVIKLLHKVSKDRLVLIVTHDYAEVKQYATRKITVNDGVIVENKTIKKNPPSKIITKTGTPKVNNKRIIKIATRMQTAYPKRFIFISLISFVFLIFASYFVNGSLTIESTYASSKSYHDMEYSYRPPSNIFLGGYNDKMLSDDDYAYFDEIVSDDIAYTKYPYYLPQNYDISLEYEDKYVASGSYFGLSSSIKNNMINGKEIHGSIPSSPNEVLIPVYLYSGSDIFDSIEDVIGKELELIEHSLYDSEYFSYNVNVVGYYIVDYSEDNVVYVNSSFFSNRDKLIEDFIEQEDSKYFQTSPISLDINGIYFSTDYVGYGTTYVIDDTMLDYQLKISSSIATSICYSVEPNIEISSQSSCESYISTNEIVPIYSTESNNYMPYVGMYRDSGAYDVIEIADDSSFYIKLNTNTYNQLFGLKARQAVFITSGDEAIDVLESNLYSNGYIEGGFSYNFDYFAYSFASLIVAIQVISNLLVLFFIVVLFSSIINGLSKTKKEDYILLRSNGSTKKNLTRIAFFEVLIQLLIVLAVYTTLLVLYNFGLFSGSIHLIFTALFSHVGVKSYLLIVAIVLLTDLYATRKFIKKVYKDSIAFGLSRGQE